MSASPPPERTYMIGTAQFVADRLEAGLYLTATPIGHLGDVTLRALSTLAACDKLLCEDTRVTCRLLERYGIKTPLVAYHEHNASKIQPGLIRDLQEGQALALVSDAGMPLVSDPGYRLVVACHEAQVAVTCVPGASAVLTGLALSGLPLNKFSFLGFLPQRSGERQRLLQEFSQLNSTLIAFESPHRIIDALGDIAKIYGARRVAVCRELTKLHEEVVRGTAQEVIADLEGRPRVRGEITLVIAPCEETFPSSADEIDAAITQALSSMTASQASAFVAKSLSLPRRQIYERILARKT